MKGFLLGIIVAALGASLALYCYFRFGAAPVATASPAMPFEKALAKMALNARISKEAPQQAPIQGSEENFMAGAHIYRAQCAVCHGLPDQPKTAIAIGMYPQVPQLFEHGVTDDPPGETYWKVAHGIRLTGMPAFEKSLSETQMWQVSLLLAQADKIPPSVQTVLHQPMVPQ